MDCDLCTLVRAVVYCKSDSARLCLQCDEYVHSANSVSLKHSRSLICDKCTSQPAVVRCTDEAISLCEGCDWDGHDCIRARHKLNPYTGCPSPEEFTRMFSLVLEMPANFANPSCSSLSINENDNTKENDNSFVARKISELASWIAPDSNYMTSYHKNPTPFSEKVIYCSFSPIYFIDIISNVIGLDHICHTDNDFIIQR